MARLFIFLLVALLLPARHALAVKECEVLQSRQNRLVGSSKALDQVDVPCGSLRNVLAMLERSKRTGGRKLHAEKPFDPVTAQSNLDTALRNSNIQARFQAMQSVVLNASERMAYEAAILDDEGYYDARNLKLQQILQAQP